MSTRFRVCDGCGDRAMYLSSPCHGLERTVCARCLDHESPEGDDLHIVCAVQGCASAPEFLLEDRFNGRQQFALCGPHFLFYEGAIDHVFRLPEPSEGREAVAGGDPADPLHSGTASCGDPVHGPEGGMGE